MSEYKKVVAKAAPTSGKPQDTPENKFWSKYTNKHTEKFAGRVSDISFSDNNTMIVCASTNVHVYDTTTMLPKKKISRFTTPVNCASVRDDGQALIAGSDDGLIQLFDLQSRSILRSHSLHKSSVYVAKFVEDGTRIFSASDDKTCKLYDLPSEEEIFSWNAHNDRIRCGIQSLISPNVVITGSYDHTIKLFDIRDHIITGAKSSNQSAMSLDHGAPVNDVIMFPNSGYVASAGENYIKIWDIIGGGKLVHTLSYHQKTITSLAIDGTGTRLISGGLDGFMKFYDVSTFEPTHSTYYPSPILSLAITSDSSTIAAGFPDGTLMTRQKPAPAEPEIIFAPNSKRYMKFHGGVDYKGDGTDVVLEKEKKVYTNKFDNFLKSFQYSSALDEAFKTHDANIVMAVLDELDQRGGLSISVQNRSDIELEPIMRFIHKYIANPVYSIHCVDFLDVILDIYTPVVGQSPLLDSWLLKIQTRVRQEVQLQDDCMSLLGELDVLLTK